MIGVVNIGKNASDVTKSVLLQPYSKVVITVDENTEYIAGNDSGLTLEISNPWGTQQMANDILQRILGYQYQPYKVTTAIIDPSVSMGDAVQANGVYGGIYQEDAIFGRTFYSDFSAPEDEKLDNENHYVSPTERRITREKAWTKTQLNVLDEEISAEVQARQEDGNEFRGALQVQSQEINAKVSQTGGNNASFGWSLLSSEFGLYSGSKKVFYCNSGGIVVNGSGTFSGEITAKTGRIGANSNGTGGFVIQANKMYTDGHPAYNTNANGVYVGTDGIGCGSSKFYVTSSGSLIATDANITGRITATSGSFKGAIEATSGTFHGAIQCTSIQFDNGVSINGSNITDGTVSDGKISGLNGSKLTDGSVGGGKVADNDIDKSKFNSNTRSNVNHGQDAYTNLQHMLTDNTGGNPTITKIFVGSVYAKNDIQSISGNIICSNIRYKSNVITTIPYSYQGSTYRLLCYKA